MVVNNMNSISSQVINISDNNQKNNLSKLSTGVKINRQDDAASLSIKAKNSSVHDDNAKVNEDSSIFSISDIDKADAMVASARTNILAKPDQSVLAQANQESSGVINLVN